jgi:hypothetical protein
LLRPRPFLRCKITAGAAECVLIVPPTFAVSPPSPSVGEQLTRAFPPARGFYQWWRWCAERAYTVVSPGLATETDGASQLRAAAWMAFSIALPRTAHARSQALAGSVILAATFIAATGVVDGDGVVWPGGSTGTV